MGLLLKIISVPFIGKMVIKSLKKNAFKPYQIPLEKAFEKQSEMLEAKFKRMERTDMGKKLGVRSGTKVQNLPLTEYSFYEPFYNRPSQSAFMYPLSEYVKMKTSGTLGTEKWFLFPRNQLLKALKETTPQMLLGVCHNGEKITLEYGDRIYVNIGAAPFYSGTTMSLSSKKIPFLDVEPNVNLPYEEKVQYFILNYEKIDVAFMMSSTLIHQVMPAIAKPIKLKGFATMDTPEVEIYRNEIEKFTGTIPKSFYASTETHTCSVMSIKYSMCFFFDWRRGLFEFFPVKNGKVEEKPLAMDEVAVGEIYQLVFTNFDNEITRFNTKDVFKCVAKGDDIINIDFPIFRLQGRLDKTISIQNFTKINEEELLTALKEAGIPFIDFTAKLESEKGLGFLALYVEQAGKMKTKEMEDALHKQLCIMDKD